jgi:peptidoglycan/LPS O-acetylase OafA/YrhL
MAESRAFFGSCLVTSTASAHRPDIDGLRAFAVVAVVCFHAFGVRGGFVGVDVFFVISGYLITGILRRDLAQGRFSVPGFYARRVRRIFPALTVVLLATLGAGWCLLWSDELQQLGQHVAAGAGFIANLMYWREAGYFDRVSEAKPLLHLWSLGIEEQFYIVWPLLLWLAAKRKWSVAWMACGLVCASFAWNVMQVQRDPTAAFYSPWGRAWELLVGAWLACSVGRLSAWPSRWREALAAGGVLCLLVGVISLDAKHAFPGAWALPPVLGAALVIAAGPQTWLNRRLWSRAGMVWVGSISYSLYLWHWPLLALATAVEGDTPTATYRVGAVVASVLLAWGSLRWVERPTRTGWPGRGPVAMMSLALAATGLLGYAVFRSDGFPQRAAQHDPRRAFLKHYRDLHEQGLGAAYRTECDFYDWARKARKASLPADCIAPGARATWFLWGDSHAQALSLGLRSVLPQGVALAQVATSACRPALPPALDLGLDGSCEAGNRYAWAQIQRLRPALVILAQAERHEQTDWVAFAAALHGLGVQHVLLVGPLPQWKPSLPLVITRYHWDDHAWHDGDEPVRVAEGLDAQTLKADQHLSQRYQGPLAQSPALTYVSLIGKLCNDAGCLAYVPGDADHTLMAVDYGHLSPPASIYVAQHLLKDALPEPR